MKRHYLRYSREYSIWSSMITRCTNPNADKYRFYGGLGISVCERWRDFRNFYEDMGKAPEGFSIDRIDSSGNYEPSNCRWADQRTQAVNRKNQKIYDFKGESLTLPEICSKAGINYRTMRNRLFRTGMSLDEALAHSHGAITESGMIRLKSAVAESNKRRAA